MVYYTYEIRLDGHSGFFWSYNQWKKESNCGDSETVNKYSAERAGRVQPYENIMNSRTYIIDCIHFSKSHHCFFPHLI